EEWAARTLAADWSDDSRIRQTLRRDLLAGSRRAPSAGRVTRPAWRPLLLLPLALIILFAAAWYMVPGPVNPAAGQAQRETPTLARVPSGTAPATAALGTPGAAGGVATLARVPTGLLVAGTLAATSAPLSSGAPGQPATGVPAGRPPAAVPLATPEAATPGR
ncbi:MAG TPA: hypothetical protein VM536_09595, partial [Chloroflexia bacterium]|nr:hypothetical protein [Chloroflexia bacterium]